MGIGRAELENASRDEHEVPILVSNAAEGHVLPRADFAPRLPTYSSNVGLGSDDEAATSTASGATFSPPVGAKVTEYLAITAKATQANTKK
jgi:hypothetical protein